MMISIFERNLENELKEIQKNFDYEKNNYSDMMNYYYEMIDFQKDIIFLDKILRENIHKDISYDMFKKIIEDFFYKYYFNEYIQYDYSIQLSESHDITSYRDYINYIISDIYENDYDYNINLREIF